MYGKLDFFCVVIVVKRVLHLIAIKIIFGRLMNGNILDQIFVNRMSFIEMSKKRN